MMTHTLFSRSAPLAIAASGALFATAAMAQDVAPVDTPIVLPPLAETAAQPAATASAPIALPDPVIETPAPVTIDAPAAPAATSAARTAPEPAAATTPRTTARPSVAAPIASAQPAPAPMASEIAPAPAEAMPMEANPLPAEIAQRQPSDRIDEAMLAGLLGAAGLAIVGGVAFASARRRRSRVVADYRDTTIATPSEPAPTRAAAIAAPLVRPRHAEPAYTTGDPVALPATIPATVEERVALIDRLAAAKPDRANPFTSRKARVKRARMIVNSLGLNFANRKPRIDLSEYTSRWPALRGWQPATS